MMPPFMHSVQTTCAISVQVVCQNKTMVTGLLNRWRTYRREMARAKRLHRWYDRVLRGKTEAATVALWEEQGGVELKLLREFAATMEFPNACIHPYDRTSVLFLNPFSDLREVEALILLEEHGIEGLDAETMYTTYRYARDLFCRNLRHVLRKI